MTFVVMVVMETMYYACVPSFTSMGATVSKFVEFENYCGFFKQFAVVMKTCNRNNRHTYQVSSLRVLPLERLRSEEVNLKISA